MGVTLRPGDVVVDKYRIERQIGSGGMGVVVSATHLQLHQSVALKFLLEGENVEKHVATERFLREARATFRLRSEHTVRVMDVGTLPTGEPFMVMELLEGHDFKQLLQQRGPLPPQEAVLYIIQACAALQEAHASGIVHRDFKARNVFVTKRVDGTPCVKVLDFGISKMESGDSAPLTQAGMGMGSPRYMAPEQWTSASTVDARADIYAAGAVLYELLTGQIPLAGLPLVEVIKRIRAGAVPSPKELRPDLPDALCRVVMRALRPRPEERFASANEFAQALRQAVPEASGDHAPAARKAMGATLPTAVVNREVLMARAAVNAHLAKGPPSSGVPTTDERPAVTAPLPNVGGDEELDNLATIVTRSPYEDAPAQHATMQVAEAPPEIQALRARAVSGSVSAMPVPPTVPMGFTPPPAPPSHRIGAQAPEPMQPPRFVPSNSAPPAPAPRSGMPAWVFWAFLIITFCAAGGLAAALLMRVLR